MGNGYALDCEPIGSGSCAFPNASEEDSAAQEVEVAEPALYDNAGGVTESGPECVLHRAAVYDRIVFLTRCV